MSRKVSEKRRAFIRLLSQAAGAGVAGTLPVTALASGRASLNGFHLAAQDTLQLYFDLDHEPADYRIFALQNPDRLVIDFYNTRLKAEMAPSGLHADVVKSIRYATHDDRNTRVVIDLLRPVKHSQRMISRSAGAKRLIVDLGVGVSNDGGRRVVKSAEQMRSQEKLRDIVVAIDAGHGGRDPGAVGPNKTREKDVTLAVAKHLHRKLGKIDGIRPVMTRSKDVYVGLRERTKIARDHKAELFISIHADAFPKKNVKGSSVYALSLEGASSEAAQWLADKENAVALFGDIPLSDNEDLNSILLDLAQNATLESSLGLGDLMLDELRRVSSLHKKSVEQANFAVLKSPDIPSVLVETAFISNPAEEKKLRSDAFQQRLANALQTAVMNYFERKAPPGTVLASRFATQRG
ncbi:N-acetylmuramoyl-L-alanine amidase [Granulosicoccaceae sp. 1_MG-2023]|nr:N-acetylmuramoyl-L-alanine amidase [Granulosicoccaceae sp. 1_MG-2023]